MSALRATLVCLALVFLLLRLPLQGLDLEGINSWMGQDPGLKLLMFGVKPFVDAFIVVELIALVRRRWRKLRSPSQRAPLDRKAVSLGFLFVCLQAIFMMNWLQTHAIADGGPNFVAQPVLVLASMVGAQAALMFIIFTVNARGLINGYALATAVLIVHETLGGGFTLLPDIEVSPEILVPLGLAASLSTLHWVGQVRGRSILPVCGIVPVFASAAFVDITNQVLMTSNSAGTSPLQAGTVAGAAYQLALAGAFTWIFAQLFRRDGGRPVLEMAALLPSLAFIAVLVLAEQCLTALGQRFSLTGCVIVLAVFRDAISDFRFRRAHPTAVSMGATHQLQRIPDLLVKLETAGIPCHVRNLNFRALWHFLAPYCPLEIMVDTDPETAKTLGGFLADDLGETTEPG